MIWLVTCALASGVLRDPGGVVPLQSLDVAVAVTGRIAEATARYAFAAPEAGSATLDLTLPEGAALAGLRFRQGPEWVEAQALPGGAPGPTSLPLEALPVEVEVTWQRVLAAERGALTVTVPLDDGGANPPGVPVDVTFDVTALAAVTEATLLPEGVPAVGGTEVLAGWSGTLGAALEVSLAWTEEADVLGAEVLAYRPAVDPFTGEEAPAGYALAVLRPGAVEPDARVERLFTLVLDTSSSMQGRSLEVATEAAATFLESLEPTDRFNLVPYTSHALPLRGRAAPATEDRLARAEAFLERQRASGLSDPAEALVTALELADATVHGAGFFGCQGTALGPDGDLPPLPDQPIRTADGRDARIAPSVVWITDGGASSGTISRDAIVAEVVAANEPGAGIFAIGIGPSADARLLAAVTRANRGEAYLVADAGEVPGVVAAIRDRIADPLLVAPRVEVPGAVHQAPRTLPDLSGGHEVVLAFRYTEPGEVGLRLTGTRGREDLDEVFAVTLPEEDASLVVVARAWAQLRIADLDARWLAGDTSVEDEILALVEAYGVASVAVPLGFSDGDTGAFLGDPAPFGDQAACACDGGGLAVTWPALLLLLAVRRRSS